jgi:CDP-paratose 2-epimerase
MKILITGICGFVGSTLAEALLDHSALGSLQITGIDNFSRSGSWLNRDRLATRGIKVLYGDIRSASDLEALGPFDWLIDAAANPSVLAGVDGKSSSRQVVEHNLGGTVNQLETCKRWNAGFILLSTSRVYSIPPLADLEVEVVDRAYRPVFSSTSLKTDHCSLGSTLIGQNGISESFSTTPPISLYGSTKLASEVIALEYGLTFNFPVWINRCGVMSGARQFGKPDQGIFAFWIHSWREGRPLKYIGFDGLGHQVRDCLHPRDLAPLVLKQISGRKSETPICNLSGGISSAMSLRQLSDWCAGRFPNSSTASSLLPVSGPPSCESRPFDLPWVVLDPSLASSIWNWQAATPVESILEEILAFAERNPDWISISA